MAKDDLTWDKVMNIDTSGLIDWPRGVNLDYFRTESTLYKDLERFVNAYDVIENPKLVDFGSGKGRIVFYMNNIGNMKATGIEVNAVSFQHLLQNYAGYQEIFPKKAKDITLLEVKAEEYLIKPDDNIFYFFNPFTRKIFEQVVRNIEASLAEHPRVADIVLYYPSFDYTLYLDNYSSFDLIQTIKTPKYYINSRECFKVYRYFPNKK